MIRSLLPIAAVLCVGCTREHPQAEVPAAAAASCTNTGIDGLIGRTRSEAVAAEAKRLSGARALRWIEPGMAVTMDYREDRLNLHLGTDGRIQSARCG